MNYIYDILLNFNEDHIYDFYEWNENDEVEYIKKIPIFRLSEDNYIKIKSNDVLIDKTFLKKIYECSEVYDSKTINVIDYACLFTNNKDAIAVEFDKDGKSIMKSGIMLDELDEIYDVGVKLQETPINFKVVDKKNEAVFFTRKEKRVIFILNKELDDIYQKGNVEKMKYIYYECFNRMKLSIKDMYEELKKFINKEWSIKHYQLYDLVRLSYMKK